MLSFYQKLAGKLNAEESGAPQETVPAKAVSYNLATGKAPPKPEAAAAPAAEEPVPEGVDPLDIDLFQSESRMVVFAQMSGVAIDGFDVVADEESNTLLIQATQKRPDLPPLANVKPDAPPEKGRFSKAESKWKSLYRKVYLPGPFDGSQAQALLEKGVLMIILPAKIPGNNGKKLAVREVLTDEHPK